jgi:hypothetical protein
MAPFVFVINSIEARHVAVNLVAVGGLLALAIEAIELRWRPGSACLTARCAVAVAARHSHGGQCVTLKIMPHRVQLDQMQAMIRPRCAMEAATRC